MRIVKISEVLTRVGEQISAVSGVVEAVYKAKTGEGQYGAWSLQDGVLKDDSGKITVTFANFSDMSRLKGSQVTISAKQGDKGLSGLIVKENEHNGKKYIKLHVTGSAMIDSGTTPISDDTPSINRVVTPPVIPDDADAEERAALELLAKKKAEKEALRLQEDARIKAQESSMVQKLGKSSVNAKSRIVQISNLYNYAVRSAVWALEKEDIKMSELPASVATLFIAFRDDGLTDSMPLELMGEAKAEEVDDLDMSPSPAYVQPDPVKEEVDQEPRTWREVKVNNRALGEMEHAELEFLFNTFKPKFDPKINNYNMQDLYIKNALLSWKKEQP